MGTPKSQAVLDRQTDGRKNKTTPRRKATLQRRQQAHLTETSENRPRPINNELQLTERGGFQDKRGGTEPRGDGSLDRRAEGASWE